MRLTNLSYGPYSDVQFRMPRLIIQSAVSEWQGPTQPEYVYAVMFSPDAISDLGFRLSELSKEQADRVRDRIEALYSLHKSQFTDAVFEFAREFRDKENAAASGSIAPPKGGTDAG